MHILIGGDSFTDPNFKSVIEKDYDSTYPKWPDYLDCKDCKITNVAKMGDCNVEIINRVLDTIYNEEVDIVIIGLSDWFRFTTPMKKFNYSSYSHYIKILENNSFSNKHDGYIDYWKDQGYFFDKYGFNKYGNAHRLINITFRKIYDLYHICKLKNIKLCVFQMLCIWDVKEDPDYYNYTLVRYFISQKIFQYLDDLNFEKKIILPGWPFISNLGGEYGELAIKHKEYAKYRVSDRDAHPNSEGHKRIGKWLNEKIKIQDKTFFSPIQKNKE